MIKKETLSWIDFFVNFYCEHIDTITIRKSRSTICKMTKMNNTIMSIIFQYSNLYIIGVLAAAGGHLGLCLGFSCLTGTLSFIQWLEVKFGNKFW